MCKGYGFWDDTLHKYDNENKQTCYVGATQAPLNIRCWSNVWYHLQQSFSLL